MTAQNGTWVSRDASDNGTTPASARLATGGMLAKNGASGRDVRKGVLWDNGTPVVTGTASMAYSIRACNVVVMPSASQGPIIVPNDGDITVATTASPGSNSRIDVIWVRQHLVAADGGADTDVIAEFGVTQGTAAASPSAPAIPTGAVELASATVTTGTTATNTLTISQTHLWTVANGAPIPVRNDTERDTLALYDVDGMLVNHLGSDELQRHDGTQWQRVGGNASAAGAVTTPSVSAADTTYSKAFALPAGRFSAAPAVVLGLRTPLTSSRTINYWITGVTTTSATLNVQVSVVPTSTTFDFYWTATEIDV